MASEASVVLPGKVKPQKAQVRMGDLFFFVMPLALLAIMLLGFAPTLYLRPLFRVPPTPGYLYVHGAILTTWFVLLTVQASLVRAGQVSIHRKIGVAGAVIAVAVVLAALMATRGAVHRTLAAGFKWDTDMSGVLGPSLKGVRFIQFESGVVWSNLIMIAAFALLVPAAILLRKNPQAHKRLMLLASIAIIGPALARISRLPYMGGEGGPMITIVLLALLLSVVANDLLSSRRLHPATLAGVALIVASFSSILFIERSDWGQQVVRMMG
jgi:hypothetical protein